MRFACVVLATVLFAGCATTGGRSAGCSSPGAGTVILSGVITAGVITASLVTGITFAGPWTFVGSGKSPCVPVAEDLTPLNAGRSIGPDRPTVPEPGGQESF